MVVRLAELEIDPAQLDDFRALLAQEIEASVRNETGVMALHAVALTRSPESIRILEIYADAAAYESHLRSEHFLRYKTLTAGMVRSLRLEDTTPLTLASKPAN